MNDSSTSSTHQISHAPKPDAMEQQISAVNDRRVQSYILLPIKPGQVPREVFAYPTKHAVNQFDPSAGKHRTVMYRDIFIPGQHQGNRCVRADRLRITKCAG